MTIAREKFINENWNAAQAATLNSGVFPEVLLSQAILESQRDVNGIYIPGASLLSAKYNNFFGIKADPSWKGLKVTLDTIEFTNMKVKGDFRVYPNKTASFMDYVKFLRTNPRYATAGVFAAKTPQLQAAAIAKAGYATSPTYAAVLVAVVKSVELVVAKKKVITTYPVRVLVL